MPLLAPSILSADFSKLDSEFDMLNASRADYIHIDVMDGVFVPNITLGFPVIKAMRKLSSKTFDVHLMIVEPDRYIEDFKKAGADILSVHIEACIHLHRVIQKIKQSGMQAGVAVNPHTSISLLENIIADIDIVCLMSVNPGFGGQSFIEQTYSKISRLKELIIQKNSSALIEIDGGVTLDNASKLIAQGADVLVAGNTVFTSSDPIKTIEQLKNIN